MGEAAIYTVCPSTRCICRSPAPAVAPEVLPQPPPVLMALALLGCPGALPLPPAPHALCGQLILPLAVAGRAAQPPRPRRPQRTLELLIAVDAAQPLTPATIRHDTRSLRTRLKPNPRKRTRVTVYGYNEEDR